MQMVAVMVGLRRLVLMANVVCGGKGKAPAVELVRAFAILGVDRLETVCSSEIRWLQCSGG